MRIGISNIAWEREDDARIASILQEFAIDTIDIAPGKYFSDFANVDPDSVLSVKRWWQERGIRMHGMQALLYGTRNLNLFGPAEVQEQMLSHLGSVARIASLLGVDRLVFGSPRNRDRTGLDDDTAESMALAFFTKLGDIAASHDVVVCLEPNPPCYQSNFMLDSRDTRRIVAAVGHPAIRMQLDTGAIIINGEDPDQAVADCASLIGHIHASDPELHPLTGHPEVHRRAGRAVRQWLSGMVVTIEMLTQKNEPCEPQVRRALEAARECYGD